MRTITIKDVLYEFTWCWDKNTTINTIMYPDEDGIGQMCQSVIKAYDELYPIYGETLEEMCLSLEEVNDDVNEQDRYKLVEQVIQMKGNIHDINTIIYQN